MRDSTRAGRRQRLAARILVAAVLAVVAAIWLVRPRGSGDSSPADGADHDAERRAPTGVRASAASSELATSARPAGTWMLDDPSLPVPVADYLRLSQYPPDSQRLTSDQVDLLEPNRLWQMPHVVRHRDGTTDPDYQVLLTGDRRMLATGDTFDGSLLVRRKDGDPVPFTVREAAATAVSYGPKDPLGFEEPMRFTPGEDGAQVTSVSFEAPRWSEHEGWIRLEVDYDYGGDKLGYEYIDLRFQPESSIPARFTGEFREAVEDGSLVVYAGVDVEVAGRYIINANVFDTPGEPVAAMRARMHLDEGAQEVPLQLFGKLLRDRQPVMPLTLTALRGYLFRRGEAPGKRHMRTYEDVYTTASYDHSTFSDAEWWSEDKQRKVEMMLRDADAGSKRFYDKGQAEAEIERGRERSR